MLRLLIRDRPIGTPDPDKNSASRSPASDAQTMKARVRSKSAARVGRRGSVRMIACLYSHEGWATTDIR